jgi:hypothetical protein
MRSVGTRAKTSRGGSLGLVIGLGLLSSVALAKAPANWIVAGAAPRDYVVGVDKAVALAGKPSAFIKAAKREPGGFGTLMQIFRADDYRGKRLRFSARVKSSDVAEWAGLWMRVDGKQDKPTAFDNMQRRPIKGTTPFTEYQVVLDVAPEAEEIAFGILLDGPGTVWMNALKFDVVDKSVPVTGTPNDLYNEKPKNLDFVE